jgi:hypothetical protein
VADPGDIRACRFCTRVCFGVLLSLAIFVFPLLVLAAIFSMPPTPLVGIWRWTCLAFSVALFWLADRAAGGRSVPIPMRLFWASSAVVSLNWLVQALGCAFTVSDGPSPPYGIVLFGFLSAWPFLILVISLRMVLKSRRRRIYPPPYSG